MYPGSSGSLSAFEAWPRGVFRSRVPEVMRKKRRLARALTLSPVLQGLGDEEVSILAAHPEMDDVLSDASWASDEWGLGDGETLEGFKLKKVLKKVSKLAKKALPFIAGAVLAVAIPGVGAAIGKGLSVVLGGLKWAGGALVSAPKAVVDAFTAQGKDIKSASPDQVIGTAQALGLLSPGTKPVIEGKTSFDVPFLSPAGAAAAPAVSFPLAKTAAEAEGAEEGEEAAAPSAFKAAAGGIGKYLPYLLVGGGALYMLTRPKKARA